MTTPPRPGMKDERVLLRAIDTLVEPVIGWLEDRHLEASRDQVFPQLNAMLAHAFDGYDRARYLEKNYGWHPDAELVEILDELYVWDAFHEVTTEWIAENKLVPKFVIGQHVWFVDGGKWRNGVIDTVYDHIAYYQIKTAADSNMADFVLVPFEDVQTEIPAGFEAAEQAEKPHDTAGVTDT